MSLITSLKQTNHNLEKIQKFILLTEGIFYNSPKNHQELDFLKLNINSYGYDNRYEKKVRRKELNLIYFLNEIFPDENSNLADKLDKIEDMIFSPEYYRKLIFHFETCFIIERINSLHFSIEKKLKLLKTEITDDQYASFVKNFSFYNLPSKKPEFINNIQSLKEYFKNLENELSSI